MIVNIKIAKSLNHYIKNENKMTDGADFDVPEGTKVSEFLGLVGFPEKAKAVIIINGKNADLDSILFENDRIFLLHPGVGG